MDGIDGSQAFSNQVLSQNSSVSASAGNDDEDLSKRRKKLKTRRRENTLYYKDIRNKRYF